MSHSALAEQSASPVEDFNWIRFDDVAATYASVLEMKAATIRLTGLNAGRFTAAKERRLPQPARPLPLD